MSSRAILFLQLGGPETLEDVPGFLYRLFSDPDVIRVRPALLRKAIAAAIALARKKASRELYRAIPRGICPRLAPWMPLSERSTVRFAPCSLPPERCGSARLLRPNLTHWAQPSGGSQEH